jgi:peptidoglycan/LPS O-acetylase OafA/YrhL
MGMFRFLLALVVLFSHAGSSVYFIRMINGRQAVVLFYVISGFYMTMILNRKYVGPGSAARFYLARVLRLWPTYLLALAFMLYVKHATGMWDNFWRPFGAIAPLPRLGILLSNFFILGQDQLFFFSFNQTHSLFWGPKGIFPDHNGYRLLLNTPAYTISIEMMFYLIAPFIVRSVRRTVAFFSIGCIYHIICFYYYHQYAIAWTYHFIPATWVYFGAGVLAYHLSLGDLRIRGFFEYATALVLVVLMLYSNLLFTPITVLFFAFAVPLLFRATQHYRFDRMLGEISYTVYIFHIPILELLLKWVSRRNLAWAGILCSLAVATVVYLVVERPINRWRARLANEAEPKPREQKAVEESQPAESVA